MSRAIIITSGKGGVGKTTSCVNIGAHIANKGKKVLIIDDVFTTGATINECSKILLKNGAAKVFVLTLARVVKL